LKVTDLELPVFVCRPIRSNADPSFNVYSKDNSDGQSAAKLPSLGTIRGVFLVRFGGAKKL